MATITKHDRAPSGEPDLTGTQPVQTPDIFVPSTREGPQIIETEVMPTSVYPDPRPYMTALKERENGVEIERLVWTVPGARAYFALLPKVVVSIPPDNPEEIMNPSKAPPLELCWNGIWMVVPKGAPVALPLPYAEIVQNMLKPLRTTQAEQRKMFVQDIGGGMGPELSSAALQNAVAQGE